LPFTRELPIEHHRQCVVIERAKGNALLEDACGEFALFFRARVACRSKIEHDEHLHPPGEAGEGLGSCFEIRGCDHATSPCDA